MMKVDLPQEVEEETHQTENEARKEDLLQKVMEVIHPIGAEMLVADRIRGKIEIVLIQPGTKEPSRVEVGLREVVPVQVAEVVAVKHQNDHLIVPLQCRPVMDE